MAKSKIDSLVDLETKIEKTENVSTKNILKDFMKEIDGMQVGSAIQTTDWVDTGIDTFNFMLSGDTGRGIPNSSVFILAGESGSGKSFLAGRCASFAQEKGYTVIWLDSEFASNKNFFERIGLDPDKMLYKEIADSEQLQIVSLKLLAKAKEKDIKLFIVLDSLGNISGSKEMADAEAEKQVTDMGNRAKSLRGALRHILREVGLTKSIFLITNHIYIEPGFVPKKKMGGGLASEYLGNIIVFLTKLKGEPGESVRLKMKTMKNREFVEGRIQEVLLNFTQGIDRNQGLIDLFREFKIVEDRKGGIGYNDKFYRESEVYANAELLAELKEKLRNATKDYGYHTFLKEEK
jgi:RecA/RadA recombinase